MGVLCFSHTLKKKKDFAYYQFMLRKYPIFGEEMFFRILPTTLLQIFCEIILIFSENFLCGYNINSIVDFLIVLKGDQLV